MLLLAASAASAALAQPLYRKATFTMMAQGRPTQHIFEDQQVRRVAVSAERLKRALTARSLGPISPMRKQILQHICCPTCYASFRLVAHGGNDHEISSGTLICENCQGTYSIVDGLPIILQDRREMAKTQEGFGQQWLWWQKGRFENHTIYGQTEQDELKDFISIFNLRQPSDLSNRFILDAGCGSGRLTKNIGEFAQDATVFGVDISEAATIAYQHTHLLDNVHVIRCDLLHLPFRPQFFDYIWSEGVIHHTRKPLASFESLDQKLSRNGRIYIWVYSDYKPDPYGLARKILWKPHLFPGWIRYGLSWLLAVPLYAFLRILGRKYRLKTVAFGFFDCFCPEFRHRHSRREVVDWFASCGYQKYRVVKDIGVVGEK